MAHHVTPERAMGTPMGTPMDSIERLRSSRWRKSATGSHLSRTIGWFLLVAALALATGVALAGSPVAGLGIGVVTLAVGLYLVDPFIFVVIVFPGAIILERIGGSSGNLSVADFLAFIGCMVSLFYVRWRDATNLRRFLVGIVWYQLVLVIVVLAHPFSANIIEWFHRFSDLAGSVLVGWVAAYYGRARLSVLIYFWAALVLSWAAVERTLTTGLQPAQWGTYQKNGIGAVLSVAMVLAVVNPDWLQLSKRQVRIFRWSFALGLIASQSRQSVIIVFVMLGLVATLDPAARKWLKYMFLALIPAAGVLYYSFATAAKTNPQFNSVSTRVDQINAAMHVWHLSPVIGMGLHYNRLPQFSFISDAPNVVVDNLSSTGLVGSVGYVLLMVVTLWALYRLPRKYGALGFALLAGRYVDGLFDIFWVGASLIPTFVLSGMMLGFSDRDAGHLSDGPAATHQEGRSSAANDGSTAVTSDGSTVMVARWADVPSDSGSPEPAGADEVASNGPTRVRQAGGRDAPLRPVPIPTLAPENARPASPAPGSRLDSPQRKSGPSR